MMGIGSRCLLFSIIAVVTLVWGTHLPYALLLLQLCSPSVLSPCALVGVGKGQVGARPAFPAGSASAGSMWLGRWPRLSWGTKAVPDLCTLGFWHTAGRHAAGAEMQLETVSN